MERVIFLARNPAKFLDQGGRKRGEIGVKNDSYLLLFPPISIIMSININTLTETDFNQLPLVIKGESKEVRYTGNGLVVIKYLPTIYSFTHNRCNLVPGSDKLRLRVMKSFLKLFQLNGIPHAYLDVNENWVLARLVMPHEFEFEKYGLPVFRPNDLTEKEIANLPRAPPIEIICKTFHGGTSKYRYKGFSGTSVRKSHPLFKKIKIETDAPYPMPIIRFDWRNPLKAGKYAKEVDPETRAIAVLTQVKMDKPNEKIDEFFNNLIYPETTRIADEILPEDLANFHIDVKKARELALRTLHLMQTFLNENDIVCNDLCLFITEDGSMVYGEITQDCGRFRHYDLGSLDKDVWRAGGSSAQVLEKWEKLAEMLEDAAIKILPSLTSSNDNKMKKIKMRIGTTNPYKVAEISSICAHLPVKISVSEPLDPEEPYETFQSNAREKALAYAKYYGANLDEIIVCEDSGICVKSLGNLPGPFSARFSDFGIFDIIDGKVGFYQSSGKNREEIDLDNCKLLLDLLKDKPDKEMRKAKFCVALVVAKGNKILFEAYSETGGYIAEEMRGENGFGYDPIFIGDNTRGLTYAELDAYRKNLRSHRREVLNKLAAWIASNINNLQMGDHFEDITEMYIHHDIQKVGTVDKSINTRIRNRGDNEINFAICKGRPYDISVELIKKFFKIDVGKFNQKDPRSLRFFKLTPLDDLLSIIKFVEIRPRDMANLLVEGIVDIGISYDDLSGHLMSKNYSIKPLINPDNLGIIYQGNFYLSFIGRTKTNKANPKNILVTEFPNIGEKMQKYGIAAEKIIYISGNAESYVVNKMADIAYTIVQTGETLRANNLVELIRDREVGLNIWTNTFNPRGLKIFQKFWKNKTFVNGKKAGVVYIEGVDGTGKSSLIKYLNGLPEFWSIAFVDRSPIITHQLTMMREEELPEKCPHDDDILPYCVIILDGEVEFCIKNICGRDGSKREDLEKDEFEAPEKLLHYRNIYLKLAEKYGFHVIKCEDGVLPNNRAYDIVAKFLDF